MNFLDMKKMNLPTTDPADLFEGYGNAATARSIEGKLVAFSKGDYFAGQEKKQIPLGARFIARMDKLKVGYTYWQNNLPTDERMGLVAEGFQPEKRKDLEDLDQANWERDSKGQPRDPWQFTNHLILHDPDSGDVCTFATNSRGGLSAVGELCKVYGKHIRQHPDEDPVVELDVGSYSHRDKAIGRVKFPIFKVVGWVPKHDPDGNAPADAEPPNPAPAPAAVAKPPAPAAKKSAVAGQQPRF